MRTKNRQMDRGCCFPSTPNSWQPAQLINIRRKEWIGRAVTQRTNTVDGRNPAPLGNHGKPLFVVIYRGIEPFQRCSGGAGIRPSTVGYHLWEQGEHSYPAPSAESTQELAIVHQQKGQTTANTPPRRLSFLFPTFPSPLIKAVHPLLHNMSLRKNKTTPFNVSLISISSWVVAQAFLY